MNRKLIGPYTVMPVPPYQDGQLIICALAWRHGWRDQEGRWDSDRNVIGAWVASPMLLTQYRPNPRRLPQ